MTDRITIITGHKTAKPEGYEAMDIDQRYASGWNAESIHRTGYWKDETVISAARKAGFVGEIRVSHVRMDYTGKGRTRTVRAVTLAS